MTVHRGITLTDFQLDTQNSYLFTYNTFIKILYVFQALPCSSSGGRRNCICAASGIVTLCRWHLGLLLLILMLLYVGKSCLILEVLLYQMVHIVFIQFYFDLFVLVYLSCLFSIANLNDWLTVHRSVTLVYFQLDAQNFYLFTYNTFIKILYMFRALPCSTSGGLRRNCIYAASGIVI